MSLISIFSLITAVIIALFVFSLIKEYELMSILTGIIGIFVIGIMWVGYGVEAVDREEEVLLDAHYTKSDYIVYVESDGKNIAKFDSKKEYEEINDSTTFYMIKEYNMYGYNISNEVIYKNEK
jgi:hypothetical protein